MTARLLITSLPKSGTHLLLAAFQKLDFRVEKARKRQGHGQARLEELAKIEGNLAVFGHYRATDVRAVNWVKENNFQVLALVRDPRDVCLSYVDFIVSGQPREYGRADPTFKLRPRSELFSAVVTGCDDNGIRIPSVRERTKGWLEWRKKGGLLTRFEVLAEIAVTGRNASFVRPLGLDVKAFTKALQASYGRSESWTFNKGTTERWRREFSSEDVDLWNLQASGVASRLGYDEIPGDFKPIQAD